MTGAADGRSHRERMLAGDPYLADDPELVAEARRAHELLHRFNATRPADESERRRILEELLGAVGEGAEIRPPFLCDYGYQIRVGARTFANVGLVALDVAPITIGEDSRSARTCSSSRRRIRSTQSRDGRSGRPRSRSRSGTMRGSAAA
jgi:maltose O-acetyltransferase